MKNIMKNLFVFLLLLSIGASGAHALYQKTVSDSKQQEPDIFRWKTGGVGEIDYHLRSFNEGRDWYVAEWDERGHGYTIKGNVETIYPGLMKEITGWETLVSLAKNEAVDLTDSGHQQLLEDVGLQVVPAEQ